MKHKQKAGLGAIVLAAGLGLSYWVYDNEPISNEHAAAPIVVEPVEPVQGPQHLEATVTSMAQTDSEEEVVPVTTTTIVYEDQGNAEVFDDKNPLIVSGPAPMVGGQTVILGIPPENERMQPPERKSLHSIVDFYNNYYDKWSNNTLTADEKLSIKDIQYETPSEIVEWVGKRLEYEFYENSKAGKRELLLDVDYLFAETTNAQAQFELALYLNSKLDTLSNYHQNLYVKDEQFVQLRADVKKRLVGSDLASIDSSMIFPLYLNEIGYLNDQKGLRPLFDAMKNQALEHAEKAGNQKEVLDGINRYFFRE